MPEVTVLNVLVEDAAGNPADTADATEWRDAYGLSFDVLADTDEVWAEAWGDPQGGRFTQHSYTVVRSDLTVAWHTDGFDGSTEREIIEAALAAE